VSAYHSAALKLGADTAVASSHVRLLGVDISPDLSVALADLRGGGQGGYAPKMPEVTSK